MDTANKMDNECPTNAAGAETTTTAAGGTKRHKKHKSRDGKRRRASTADDDGKSPESAVSISESTVKTRKRSKKGREARNEEGAKEERKAPEAPSPPVAAPPKKQDDVTGALPPTSMGRIPASMTSQQAAAVSQPPLPRPEPSIQKDGAAVPATEERSPDDVILVSAVACVVIIVGLALAVVGIILGMMIPAGEHGCPPLDKPLTEGNVVVQTQSGRLVGTVATVEGVKLAGFLGIPFAHSTAGERRFRAPVPVPASGDACAVREYLQQQPPCAQLRNGTVVGSEDCLHVNVWTPAAALEHSGQGAGLPLVVTVSGSWFETGSNDDSDWPMLAAKVNQRSNTGDVVVVVPNHRQGVLGFLHPSNVSGVDQDVAVDDIVSAVQWARDHAPSFGADPNELVLVGFGSGAYLLSWAVRKMSKDTARRAFYQGTVFGSLLPFDPAAPYRSLALALHCNDSNMPVSAWLPCFRAAPVDELLRAARTSSPWPLQFAPHVDIGTLKSPPASTPSTVVAGVDAADDKALFMERILPLAKRDGSASTPKALVEYTLNVFNVPQGVKPFIRGLFKAESADDIADTLSMISTCASLKVARAVAEGYHYRMDSTADGGLLRPPLGITEVAQFAENGTLPPLADKSTWLPLTQTFKTRVFSGDGAQNFTSYVAECRKYKRQRAGRVVSSWSSWYYLMVPMNSVRPVPRSCYCSLATAGLSGPKLKPCIPLPIHEDLATLQY
ncbi:hypothetical protein HPB50_000355 [Hyalomma asiaticum]|uniref:Uncharacterized protein n=1 Tax=Hyalomma asiaticum TaxID=266040 RepID=A0ACB7SF31_HYAAI|nr:hypothetical protein HPB50_000355 [Hyalomma asiaticum]